MTEEQKVSKTPFLLVGVDIGSTTTKLAVMTEDILSWCAIRTILRSAGTVLLIRHCFTGRRTRTGTGSSVCI